MSAVALNAALSPMPLSSSPAGAATEPNLGDLGFGSILTKIDGGAGKEAAQGKKIGDPAGSESSAKPRDGGSENRAASDPSLSLEAALAALGYGSILSAAGAPAPAQTSAAGSQAGKIVGRTAFAGAAALGSATGSASDGSDSQGLDFSGAVPLKNLLASDASLGLQSFQPKTHLAVAEAIPVRSGAALRRAASSSAIGPASGAAAAPGSRAPAGSAAIAAESPGGSGANNAATGRGSSGGALLGSASSGPSEAAPAAAANDASLAPVAPGAGAPVSATLDQLPDVIAEQASALKSASDNATPLTATQAVKELEIALDPAELGALSVKLRLTGGKLSVVIGVANPKTLAAVEGDRDAIARRLGVDPDSMDSLIIRSQEASQVHVGGNDAADPHAPSQGDAQSQTDADPASRRSGDAQRRAFAGAASGAAGPTPSVATGDLIV